MNEQQRQIRRIRTKFPDITGEVPNGTEKEKLLQWMNDMAQNGIVVDAHIRLFVAEFIQYATPRDYDRLLSRFAINKTIIFNKWGDDARDKAQYLYLLDAEQAEREKENTLYRDLFLYVSNRPDQEALVQLLSVIARCKDVDPKAYEELHLNTLPDITYYAKLYAGNDERKIDRIRTVLEPKHIIKWFTDFKQPGEYDQLLERVANVYTPNKWDTEKREIETAACLFIRGLVHCTDGQKSTKDLGDWYYDFLEALKSHGDCRMFPRLIDPDYEEELVHWNARKNSRKAAIAGDGELIKGLIDEEERPTSARDQRAFLKYRSNDEGTENYEPESYELRPYQNELVMQAKGGRNTIICAPTGSGKTLIAVDIIRNHLETVHEAGKVGRFYCVMLVPTVPLVDQQSIQIVQYLTQYRDQFRPDVPYWVDGFSGCENYSDGRAFRLLASDICVMTPQILINMMNSVLKKERVYFSDFSLIIFDECHHCDKGHPYKILMKMLENEQAHLPDWRPQVVGLTASMGVGESGGGWDMRACRAHMLKLCSNMMAQSISTVRHQLDNLRNYVMPPVDIVERVKRPQNNPFVEDIQRVMGKIETDMTAGLKEQIERLKINAEDINFPPHDAHSRYQTMVGTLKKHVNRVMDSEKRFFLVRSIDHLAHYFHAILISDLLPNKYALEYLEAKMANYGKRSNNDPIDQINCSLLNTYSALRVNLVKYCQTENAQNKAILKKLHETLNDQFNREPDSRCMIFVATRSSAQKLSDYLNQEPLLPMFHGKNNVGHMVSSNQSSTAGGQSNQEQQKMRQDFNKGKIKVLVVTSVAEEGLDIAACNLIIKYNNVGSERSMIQRRGRARQKNSRSILLALDTSIEVSEFHNIRKEAMMMACIQNLQESDEMTLRGEIEAMRIQMLKMQEEQERREMEKRDRLMGRRYKLCCNSCSNVICHSHMVRCVADSLYFVCDPEVWKRSKFNIRMKPTKDELTTKCAIWLCGKCNKEWGSIVKYSNCYLPQLSAGNFTMDRQDMQNEFEAKYSEGSRRTWNILREQFFNIDPISTRNIREMYAALLAQMPNKIKEMDEQEYIANVKFFEKMADKKNQRKNKIQLYLEE